MDSRSTPAVIVRKHGQGRTIYLNTVITDYHRWRMRPPEGENLRQYVWSLLAQGGVAPQYRVTAADGKPALGVEVHPWRCGDLSIIAIHRNYGLRVSELGPPEYQKQDFFERPLEIRVDFGKPVAVYDQREGKFLGVRRTVTFPLDKYEPSILAILPGAVKAMNIAAQKQAKRGELIEARLALDGPKLGQTHAFRVRLLGPDGRELRPVTANLAAPKGQVTWKLPIAASDPAGEYTLEARDIATGTTATHKLAVE